MMRVIRATLLACLLLVVWAGFIQAEEEKGAVPIIEINGATYDFGQVVQGEDINHEFQVFNRGDAPLEIKSVKPG